MLLILILTLFTLSQAVHIPDEIDSNAAPGEPGAANCTYTRHRKTLDWNYNRLPFSWEEHKYITYVNLSAPGKGFVWRGEAWYTPDVTRPILFRNGQGWRLVNCSAYFAADDPAQGGCTSPDMALLSMPDTKTGDAPPEKGKLGTISGLRYPETSYWAVYELIEFRLTPVVPARYYDELITVEVFGWYEDGSKATTLRFKIKGAEVGYRVELPPGGWDRILQWQVRVWWSAGSRATREEFQYLIDDVVIDEYALESKQYTCRYPVQVPSGDPVVTTLKFDDVPAVPGIPIAIPTPYHGYIFDNGVGNWSVVNAHSYPLGTTGRLSASSSPNSLLLTPGSNEWMNSTGIITTVDFLFDIDSFRITIDNTTARSENPENIWIIMRSYTGCYEGGEWDMTEGYMYIVAPSHTFDVDLTGGMFRKDRAVSIIALDMRGDYGQVPFWIDEVVVRSWRDALSGLPGCERCGIGLGYWCEYPVQERLR